MCIPENSRAFAKQCGGQYARTGKSIKHCCILGKIVFMQSSTKSSFPLRKPIVENIIIVFLLFFSYFIRVGRN